MKTHYLFPGQFVVYREPCLVTTILGSCVAVALFDPRKRIAGLNHFLLPQPGSASGEQSLRYGSVALPAMIESMLGAGASIDRLQAKVYGGGKVMDNFVIGESIGKQNIDFAIDYLTRIKIPVVGDDLGGSTGRKIILNTFDFSVTHQLMGGNSICSTSGGQSALLKRTVRVVIVDDSSAVRTVMSRVLEQSGRIKVVGTARDAYEAREVIVKESPDVILLDIEMPRMSGVKFLEKLMQHFPIPTIMVSSLNPDDDAAVKALEIGALEFVQKPDQFDPNTLRFFAENLVQKVVAAASSSEKLGLKKRAVRPVQTISSDIPRATENPTQLILVGGNGGAHADLDVFLKSLPSDTPPILVSVGSVSEHLSVFLGRWKSTCRLQLREAVDGLVPLRGTVYFAPNRQHLAVEQKGGQTIMRLKTGAPVCLQMPSSEVLFESAAKTFQKSSQMQGVVSFLMSGFGTDGVQGLIKLREYGATTIVAHPESCLFSFTPQAAIEAGAADDVLKPEDFAQALMQFRSRAAV